MRTPGRSRFLGSADGVSILRHASRRRNSATVPIRHSTQGLRLGNDRSDSHASQGGSAKTAPGQPPTALAWPKRGKRDTICGRGHSRHSCSMPQRASSQAPAARHNLAHPGRARKNCESQTRKRRIRRANARGGGASWGLRADLPYVPGRRGESRPRAHAMKKRKWRLSAPNVVPDSLVSGKNSTFWHTIVIGMSSNPRCPKLG